jgi:hypothetical protein
MRANYGTLHTCPRFLNLMSLLPKAFRHDANADKAPKGWQTPSGGIDYRFERAPFLRVADWE